MSGEQKGRQERDAAVVMQVLGPQAGSLHGEPLGDESDEDAEMAEFHRQQQAFHEYENELDERNRYLAIPAFAPYAAVLALEGGALLGSRLAAPVVRRAPFRFVKRDPIPKVGDNWATRGGRRAHKALKERLSKKPGWDYEPRFPGTRVRPDVGAPVRNLLQPWRRRIMEYKPDTPSGHRAADKAIERYFLETGNKARGIFYKPKPYI